LLLWLGWKLVGTVAVGVPQLPPGSTVLVQGTRVGAEQLAEVLGDQARHDVLRVGLIAFCLVVLSAAVLAWTLTGRLLRPLHEVTATARKLSAESLTERIGLRGPRDEVTELAETFDGMLDRLESAFTAQRRFVANASHELRTPLSVIRTELDVTLSDPDTDADELRRMAEVVRGASMRAGQLVEALLLLARTDGVGLAVRDPVDLAAVAGNAWAAVSADAECRALATTFKTPGAHAIGDPALLERVAGNLLENAVRHNVDGGWIEVRTEGGPEWSTLRVASSGREVPAELISELFEPFRRAGTDRTAQTGTGLGLSIVRAVVDAHGGRVSAEPIGGGGLAVTVALPAAP
jgi:signal transduction histidine kinase